VQTRAFSFSDDSAKVGQPFQRKPPSSPSPIASNSSPWTRSNDISLAYIKLRQMQSAWYTKLFQTSRKPLDNCYDYIWKVYREMTDWFNTLPENTPPQIKSFFEFDLLYSYVYILSPSSGCPQPSEHAQRLIFEHGSTYAKKVRNALGTNTTDKTTFPFTFYDALRAYMIGRLFVDTLNSNFDNLLQPSQTSLTYPTIPINETNNLDPQYPSPSITAPALTPDTSDVSPSLVVKALDTIETFLSILSAFDIRFGYVSGMSWRDKLQQEAASLLTLLQQRLHTHRNSADSSSYFWTSPSGTNGPLTPAGQSSASILGTSPGSQRSLAPSVSFYPSPPATQYSPNYLPADHLEASAISINGAPWFAGNEFGIDNMAAWKTLPGGTMNARFS